MKKALLSAALIALALSACAAPPVENVPIRIGVLPIIDALPLYVADAQGYFTESGVTVELIPVSSGAERDQLMQAGQIDAMINELISTMFYNREAIQTVVVRFARVPLNGHAMFTILASANSGISDVAGLAGVPIGISEGTIIEYTTDRILENRGLSADQIVTLAVPRIPDRLALLASGELLAANLPEPLATLAEQGGAVRIVDDLAIADLSHSVISFSKSFVDQHPQTVRAFLAALERAVSDINADKQQWTGLLAERSLVPPPIAGSYLTPDFPTASVPDQALFADALRWVQEKNLVSVDVPYAGSVDGSFLP